MVVYCSAGSPPAKLTDYELTLRFQAADDHTAMHIGAAVERDFTEARNQAHLITVTRLVRVVTRPLEDQVRDLTHVNQQLRSKLQAHGLGDDPE